MIENKMKDNFELKAKTWDNQTQIKRTSNFVDQLCYGTFLFKEDNIAEVGCGTGLVGLKLSKLVNKIYMIDNSPSMLNVLREKIKETNINNVEVIEGEFENSNLNNLSGLISFMTLHHIEDISYFIDKVKEKLIPNGFIAIGDIVQEDGSFHSDVKVPHLGFNVEELSKTLEEKGFTILRKSVYDSIEKNNKDYPLFIIIAQK